MEYQVTYIVLAAIFGGFMAWGIGANDVANAMATSVGSKAITIKQAIIIAAIFEFAGAVLAGGAVTSTIRKGIITADSINGQPELLIFGMLSSLLAAGIWLLLASRKGWPVSTTHSVIGAVVGFAAVGIGTDAIQWSKVVDIVLSWVVTPLIAGILAFFIFQSVHHLILKQNDPLSRAKRYVPFYMFITAFVLTLVTIKKGLKHIGLHLTDIEAYGLAVLFGILVAIIGAVFINRIKPDKAKEKRFHFYTVERVFAVLMVITASGLAFAHGSNDVANAVGPLAAVISTAQSGMVAAESALETWVLMLGAVGIVIGLATYGVRVIRTVGQKITHLTPSRGFAAELAASTTIVVASGTGMPISTTQTLVGAVLGVGMARGISAIDLKVVRNIFASWVVTIPAGAALSIIFFFIFKFIFG
ncbi:inorganic phosphate transporter [Marinicella gelatinilytica]|uniref:inorganic phosphate transporter n=1 Tax=Marinicella gelatinilytica TaxID=2996017 RepID=UPI002260A230|nr:inorganic phosphate transporter [Marinicella gelatinilytica]MCX7544235.1 inorganic phosphate transporter [Marinicella gelatinilytica]